MRSPSSAQLLPYLDVQLVMSTNNIRQFRKNLNLAFEAAIFFHHMFTELPLTLNGTKHIPSVLNPWQADMLQAEMVTDLVDLILGRGKHLTAGGRCDAHEGVFGGAMVNVLLVAELQALVIGAAVLLLLLLQNGAGVDICSVTAGVIDVQDHAVGNAVILKQVETAGFNRKVKLIGRGGAVALRDVEAIGQSGGDKEEKSHCPKDQAEMDHDE